MLAALLRKAFLPRRAGGEEPGREQERTMLLLHRNPQHSDSATVSTRGPAVPQLIETLVNKVADEVSRRLSQLRTPQVMFPRYHRALMKFH